jgi:hypothetical protein
MPEERKTPAEWCEEYKRLDKLFMTSKYSPTHHDMRCQLCKTLKEKSPVVNDFLEDNFGRTTALKTDTCTICKEPATQFKDDLSRREYRISGMCQACQDEVFSSSEEY